MKDHLKILLIDGDETDRESVGRLLKRSRLNVNLKGVGDCNCGIEKIKAQDFFSVLFQIIRGRI